MSNSINYNGTDLSAYGLNLLNYDEIFEQLTESAQLKNQAYQLGKVRPARIITLDVKIIAANLADRQSYLDSIKGALNVNEPAVLKINSITDRYWLAVGIISGAPVSARVWSGTIIFTCFDPDAYDNSETTSSHTIDDDPENFNEVVGGTAETKPVYTLTKKTDISLDFDGVDDYVNVPHNANQLLTTGGTIRAWVQVEGLGENNAGMIVDKSTGTNGQNGFYLRVAATNKFACVINNGTIKYSAENSFTPGDGIWHHVVVTWDATGLVTFYVDSAQSGTPGISADPAGITTTNDLRIANRSGATDRTFNGRIKGVYIGSGQWSAADVAADYAQGHQGSPTPYNITGIVGLWQLDDNTGTTAEDSSPAGNDGTISGATWVDVSPEGAATVIINNTTAEEEFSCTVTLVADDILVIDTETMVVTLNDTEVMNSVPVTSQWPRLLPGTNSFTVEGFSGTMATVYRKRYL